MIAHARPTTLNYLCYINEKLLQASAPWISISYIIVNAALFLSTCL